MDSDKVSVYGMYQNSADQDGTGDAVLRQKSSREAPALEVKHSALLTVSSACPGMMMTRRFELALTGGANAFRSNCLKAEKSST